MLRSTLPLLFERTSVRFFNPKSSTGWVGVPVIPDARLMLKDLYERILIKVKEIPEDYPYRIDLEHLVNYRLKVIHEEEDCSQIEERINSDQVELLIYKARDELNHALPLMIESKLWETPGWKTRQIPIEILQFGEGPMDISSFTNEELHAYDRKEEILKEEEAERKRQEAAQKAQKKE